MKRKSGALGAEDVATEAGLSAQGIHERLVRLVIAHRRVESALCFYLLEVESRALFQELGHASTVDYARECLGLEDRKTRALLRLAIRFQELPKMKEAFAKGDIPYTKARDVVNVATPETEEMWIQKCKELTNRQLERDVKQELPPERTRCLSFLLDESRILAWEGAREAMERIAGKTLTDIEVFDLVCASAMLEHDMTPPLGPEGDTMTGYVAKVIQRDGFRCTRPGCSSRSALQGSHIKPRAQGGSDDPSNIHTACAVCHRAIELRILKVSGTAPDDITWEGPFGIIESPRPNTSANSAPLNANRAVSAVREPEPTYGSSTPSADVPRGTKSRRPTWDALDWERTHAIRSPGEEVSGATIRSSHVGQPAGSRQPPHLAAAWCESTPISRARSSPHRSPQSTRKSHLVISGGPTYRIGPTA